MKNNKAVIIAFILGVLISGVTVYGANYAAKTIDYTTSKNVNVKTIADALNDLYNKNLAISFMDSGSTIGTSINTERTITKELDVGKYFIILNEFNTNEFAGSSTTMRLDNNKNSFTLLKSDNKYSAQSYASSTVVSTYYVTINEKGNAVFAGRDVYNYSGGGAGLLYQIYKID